jgi:hypothetical protein
MLWGFSVIVGLHPPVVSVLVRLLEYDGVTFCEAKRTRCLENNHPSSLPCLAQEKCKSIIRDVKYGSPWMELLDSLPGSACG